MCSNPWSSDQAIFSKAAVKNNLFKSNFIEINSFLCVIWAEETTQSRDYFLELWKGERNSIANK